MNKNNQLLTKNHLVDYVTRFEFNEFRDEMRDFRNETEIKFSSLERRMGTLEKRMDTLEDNITKTMGAYLDMFKDNLKTAIEYFQNVDAKKVDIKDFESLKIKVEAIMRA